MATSMRFQVNTDLDLTALAAHLAELWQKRGYTAVWRNIGAASCIQISRNDQGFYQVIGMCEGMKVNLIRIGEHLTVNLTEERWTDKIIAAAIGGFLSCGLIWVTCAIGVYRQLELRRNVLNEIQIHLGSM